MSYAPWHGRKLRVALLHVGDASGAAVGRFAPYGIDSGKLFRRIHGWVPRARSATLPDSSALGDSHAALGFAERTMPGALRGVHPFSTSSAGISLPASAGKIRLDSPPCLLRTRALPALPHACARA